MSQPLFFTIFGRCYSLVFLTAFSSLMYSSSGVVICPLHASPAQQGSPGRTNPHRRVWSSPTIPSPLSLSPSPTLSASSCPTVSLPICPASLPYDLAADKARGPAVPSAWCQHFPLIQSLSCCVTDGIGDQKQQPCSEKNESNYETIGLHDTVLDPFSPQGSFSLFLQAF